MGGVDELRSIIEKQKTPTQKKADKAFGEKAVIRSFGGSGGGSSQMSIDLQKKAAAEKANAEAQKIADAQATQNRINEFNKQQRAAQLQKQKEAITISRGGKVSTAGVNYSGNVIVPGTGMTANQYIKFIRETAIKQSGGRSGTIKDLNTGKVTTYKTPGKITQKNVGRYSFSVPTGYVAPKKETTMSNFTFTTPDRTGQTYQNGLYVSTAVGVPDVSMSTLYMQPPTPSEAIEIEKTKIKSDAIVSVPGQYLGTIFNKQLTPEQKEKTSTLLGFLNPKNQFDIAVFNEQLRVDTKSVKPQQANIESAYKNILASGISGSELDSGTITSVLDATQQDALNKYNMQVNRLISNPAYGRLTSTYSNVMQDIASSNLTERKKGITAGAVRVTQIAPYFFAPTRAILGADLAIEGTKSYQDADTALGKVGAIGQIGLGSALSYSGLAGTMSRITGTTAGTTASATGQAIRFRPIKAGVIGTTGLGFGTFAGYSDFTSTLEQTGSFSTSLGAGIGTGASIIVPTLSYGAYTSYKYLNQPITRRVDITPPKQSFRVANNEVIGTNLNLVKDGKNINSVIFGEQKLGQTGVPGSRTIVTSKWRELLNMNINYYNTLNSKVRIGTDYQSFGLVPKLPKGFKVGDVYGGVPSNQPARWITGTSFGREYNIKIKPSGYESTLKWLKKYGYSDYGAKSTLRYTPPKVVEQWLDEGVIKIGKKGSAKALFSYSTRQPKIIVDDELNIKTKGARNIKDIIASEKSIIKEGGLDLVKVDSFRVSAVVDNKGIAVKPKGFEFTSTKDLVKSSEIKTGSQYLGKRDLGYGVSNVYKNPAEFQQIQSLSRDMFGVKFTSTGKNTIVDFTRNRGQFFGNIIKNPKQFSYSKTTLYNKNVNLDLGAINKGERLPKPPTGKDVVKLDLTKPSGNKLNLYEGITETQTSPILTSAPSPPQIEITITKTGSISAPAVSLPSKIYGTLSTTTQETKTDTTTKIKQEQVLDTGLKFKSMQKQGSIFGTATQTKQIQKSQTKQIQKSAQKTLQKTLQKTALSQRVPYSFISRTTQPKIKQPKQPEKKYMFGLPIKGTTLTQPKPKRINIYGRRFGKWKSIGFAPTQRQAVLKGKSWAERTLGVSFKTSNGLKPLKIKGFKAKSTKEGTIYIEKIGRRLKKGTKEVPEINLYRGLKGGKK